MTVPDHADALVIGAGLSGAVVAHRLARTGIAVTCIEQGRWHDREDYRGRSDDWANLVFDGGRLGLGGQAERECHRAAERDGGES